jgi:hypothetical protein
MKDYKVTADVYARWTDSPVRYRIYINSDLLAERQFIWNGGERYLREHLFVRLPAGQHELKLQAINDGAVDARNITVNGVPSSTVFVTQ